MPCERSIFRLWPPLFLAMPKSNRTTNDSNALRRKFEMPYAELALFIVKLLGVPGPYTMTLDRTNWKVGAVDLNVLMLSIVYRAIANSSDANGFAFSSAIGSNSRCVCTRTRWSATDGDSMRKPGG